MTSNSQPTARMVDGERGWRVTHMGEDCYSTCTMIPQCAHIDDAVHRLGNGQGGCDQIRRGPPSRDSFNGPSASFRSAARAATRACTRQSPQLATQASGRAIELSVDKRHWRPEPAI